jgi:hypothetical protein
VRQTPSGTVYQLPSRGSPAPSGLPAPVESGGAHMSLPFADKCLRNAHYLLLRQGPPPGIWHGRRGGQYLRDPNLPNLCRAAAAGHWWGAAGRSISTREPPSGSQPPGGSGVRRRRRGCASGRRATRRPRIRCPPPSGGPEAASGTDSPSTQEVLEALALDPHYSPMLQAVYVDMAYVALALHNPSIALHEAKQLLNMPNCSKENKCPPPPSNAVQGLISVLHCPPFLDDHQFEPFFWT